MALQFTVLASGSSGNSSLLTANGFGVLIDVGLGPRQLASRMKTLGESWNSVHAVLLTHTHGDHWKEPTLTHLRRHEIPLYCHPDHERELNGYSIAFAKLRAAGLVRTYAAGHDLTLAQGFSCKPLPVRHDAASTFGFRFEAKCDLFPVPATLGYLADLGTWDATLADHLLDLDILAVEFNHDVQLEYASGRSPRLIARVLGDDGHLSNDQAAALLKAVLKHSTPGRLRHVVQLHLSRECNRPHLAFETARRAVREHSEGIEIHTAKQHRAGPSLAVGNGAPRKVVRRSQRSARVPHMAHPCFPEFEFSGEP